MSSKELLLALSAALVLGACGGGGGGGGTPPPPPPPSDTTPPDTTLSGGPPATTTQRTASFTLTSSEANSTFQASLDGAAYVVVTSPHSLSNVADGAHTLSVRARDAANNVDPSPATYSWTVDGTAPTVRIEFPGANAYTDAGSIQIRGTAQEAGTITSLTVNGVAATSSDGFRHWSANVVVNEGTNTYPIATVDNLGNSQSPAITATIINRGIPLHLIRGIALDTAHNRVLVTDWEQQAIIAIDIDDRVARIFSGVGHGTGDALGNPYGLTLDAPRDRLLVHDNQRVVAIDLATGNRSYLSSMPANTDLYAYGGATYDAATNLMYVANPFPNSVIAIDLTNDTRWMMSSNGIGFGPSYIQANQVVVDTSAVGGGTRLVVSDVGARPGTDPGRLIAVDIATGNRTLLSSSGTPSAGTGPALLGIGNFALDAANNRLLVSQYEGVGTTKLLAVDLTTGNRTLLADSGSTGASAMFAFQPGATRGYLGLGDRARLLSFDFPSQQLAPFHESTVGTGPAGAQYNSVRLDSSGATPTLLLAAQLSPFGGSAGALRVDPATGARTEVTGTTAGSGEIIRVANSAQRDTRANAPANQLLIFDTGTFPARLYGVNATNGVRTVLHSLPDLGFYSLAEMSLDPSNGRMIAGVRGDYGTPLVLTGIDVATGALTPISGGALGTGPDLGSMTAIAIDAPAGGARRYVVATPNPFTLLAVDPANGNRTVLSSGQAGVGTGPWLSSASDVDIDSAARRALVLSDYGTLVSVDLVTGNRSVVSGIDPENLPVVMGTGPQILEVLPRVRADFAAGVAYVAVSSTVYAIDLATGQRAIVSK